MIRSLQVFILLLGWLPLSVLAVDPEIRTPPTPPGPSINGPRVYGARPDHPFFYHLQVTGERPMKFAAHGLPAGLTIDPEMGNVTGTVAARGTYPVEFTAANGRGIATATVDLVIGDTICLTPPLGWNSWNHFAGRVTEKDVRDAADAMVSSGLIDHGWTYINVDDCWQGERDAEGNIQGNAKFPDMKALADYVHARGLKFGVYSSPGPKTCAGFAGSYGHEDQDARTYAAWGVDYVKYDLCSYGKIIREHADVPPLEAQQTPYRVFGQSLAKVPRDIVYSLCQYGNANVWEWGASLGGNCWRTTGDIQANWQSMSGIGFSQDRLAKFAGPGHWNDPDMLEVGNVGLTPDECYTHMTLWAMLSAPLLIGCDMSKMDPFTTSLFSNDEVLAVDQDALGKQGYRLKAEGMTEVWVKPLTGGAKAVALFNRGDAAVNISVSWADLERQGGDFTEFASQRLRFYDLWRGKKIQVTKREITLSVAPHGAELLRVEVPETVF